MDHGCDAFGVSFLTLGVASVSLVSNMNTIMFTGQLAVLFIFWVSCWAQYHAGGVLILGKKNIYKRKSKCSR